LIELASGNNDLATMRFKIEINVHKIFQALKNGGLPL
jgi:hypothetical protein